jgi:hypothetical protein
MMAVRLGAIKRVPLSSSTCRLICDAPVDLRRAGAYRLR